MNPHFIDASNCPSPHSLRNKIGRVLWTVVWATCYRPSPKIFHGWRRFLLRFFGGKIGYKAHLYPSAKIWAPWNLEMGDYSCMSHDVDCYCVAPIKIGAHATVSQYTYLCTASHDCTDPLMPLVTAPISIGPGAWVAADVFIGPGVVIGEGAVVGVRSSVFKEVGAGMVVVGNPATFLKRREMASCSPAIPNHN
jgi:putative colanic acid biosynthesis acetyltransferase WcaF